MWAIRIGISIVLSGCLPEFPDGRVEPIPLPEMDGSVRMTEGRDKPSLTSVAHWNRTQMTVSSKDDE